MNKIKILITRAEDFATVLLASFREDGSFASAQARKFVGNPSNEDIKVYAEKLIESGVDFEYLSSVDKFSDLQDVTDELKSVIENAVEYDINDDPSTSKNEAEEE